MIDFKFKSTFSLDPIIKYWEEQLKSPFAYRAQRAREVIDAVESAPELRGSVNDYDLLEKNGSVVNMLMSDLFPNAMAHQEMKSIGPPGGFLNLYSTRRFAEIVTMDGTMDHFETNVDFDDPQGIICIYAYLNILSSFYKTSIEFYKPIVLKIKDKTTGLPRYYQVESSADFIEVHCIGKKPKITPAQIKEMTNNLLDKALWEKYIQPENFELYGFVVISLIDITDQEVLSDLKYNLLQRNTLSSNVEFAKVEEQIQTFFGLKEVELKMAAFDNQQVYVIHSGDDAVHRFGERYDMDEPAMAESIFIKAFKGGEIIIIEDLAELENRTMIEDALLESGVRNMIVAPIKYEGEVIGMLGLKTGTPGLLNAISAMRLRDLLPLFAIAIKRGMEEFFNNIQAVIKEKYTAIHPSVEWRFREAAINYITALNSGEQKGVESIVFKDVYPLYGLSDIRGSSTFRNQSIQQDLTEQLSAISTILAQLYDKKQISVIDELKFNVDQFIDNISLGLNSGDEVSIINFIHAEVESVFRYLEREEPSLKSIIQPYWSLLDPELGVLYKARKAFETSLTRINDMVASFLEIEQEQVQKVFPHYFEKYKTDGVDHNIYIGASLVDHKNFDDLYLKSLRIWQLKTMAEIARLTNLLKDSLEVPLETTHLLLVHSSPLSVRFRLDEKQFDVDGAYNIRYEIIKKRIDKAYLRGTNERLTQPGKIAIVYTQESEAVEYHRYISYLQAKGYFGDQVEEVQLEDLQGVSGLRAIRVGVTSDDASEEAFPYDEIMKVAKSIDV